MTPLPLDPACREAMASGANLLAFSAGTDSTALFHTLRLEEIPFAAALVRYDRRPEAGEEAAYAKELCEEWRVPFHLLEAEAPERNFEAEARKIRYGFFREVAREHGYQNLVTAHHLGDRLEGFLMQLAKGAGLSELLSLQKSASWEEGLLLRPLLEVSRKEILAFLEAGGFRYFRDRTNDDPAHLRNRFRREWAGPLMEEFGEGIRQSFGYLEKELELLEPETEVVWEKELARFVPRGPDTATLRTIDRIVKKLGYLPSSGQRREILEKRECVIGGKVAVGWTEALVYVAPYRTPVLPKEFKERCRKAGVPPLVRGYLFDAGVSLPVPLSASPAPSPGGCRPGS